ncbi:TlpA disulfide reductase family protein [Marivirga salinae]|uniref:TlpA disulfide reductase family protein n=1 Tax=Marivirga salinarum TaxID=3059078 RepID=A0AA51NCA0_9BACT|nr:TlpA disulfide reductase family protein [Marivirga sp. BDSF4-3]WMN10946.1 TlpA disulfide reductase family protein [Marivirga sp. BDSF4-3]
MRLIVSLFCINLLLICQTQAQKKTKIKFSANEWQDETLILEKTDQHFIPEYYAFKEIQPTNEVYIFELEKADFYNLKIADNSYGIYLQPGFTYNLESKNGKLNVDSEDPLNYLLAENQKQFEEFQKKNTNLIGKEKKNYDSNYEKYIEEIKQLIDSKALTEYAEDIIFYELKHKEFNTLKNTKQFKELENDIINNGVLLDNKAFIMLINNVYPIKANSFDLIESDVPPSKPTLYLLDEAKYVPNDTLEQFVELIMLNNILYGSFNFEPNDSLINSTLEKILNNPINPTILKFAQVLKAKMNQLKEGKKVPDFQFELLDQSTKKLSDYKDQYVLLDFWYSGCQPCLKAVPKLNALEKENENLSIIGIDPVDTEERFLKAIDKFNIKYAQTLVDGNSEMRSYFNVGGYPTYVLIDPDGKYIKEFNSTNLNEIKSYLK